MGNNRIDKVQGRNCMMIRDMFADDINRKINGVIKVDQAADDVICLLYTSPSPRD